MNRSKEPETLLCKYCGIEFKRKRTTQPQRGETNEYCSRACGYKGRRLKTIELKEEEKRQKKEKNKAICIVCGQEFIKKTINSKHCSRECQYFDEKKKVREKYNKKPIYNKTCPKCSVTYLVRGSILKSPLCPTCSLKALRREHKQKREMVQRGVYIEDVPLEYIYMRDNGICQICKKKVKLNKDTNHNEHASLDHIIPLSKGGVHASYNIQLAHRICNSIKNNKSIGEQIRLC
jgi:hypothetical protein